jgi:hypothetical protein
MSIALFVWQFFIFFTIFFSGKYRGWTSAFWFIWTLVQIYSIPLSIVQFFTILLAYMVSKQNEKDR